MKFFRVENESGRGPYSHWTVNVCAYAPSKVDGKDRHPALREDSKLCEVLRASDKSVHPSDYRFGFGSLAQLRRWFYTQSVLEVLHTKGFKLAIYDFPKVYKGHTQAVVLDSEWPSRELIEKRSVLAMNKKVDKAAAID